MRTRAAIFLFVVPCLAAACHDDKPKTEASHAPSAEPIPSDLVYNAFVEDKKPGAPEVVAPDAGAGASAETGASTVKLVDPGADPKSPLRYAFGTKTRSVDTTITISGASAPGAPPQPPLHFTFTATPKPKNLLGHDATVDVKVTKFEITLPPGMPPNATAAKEQLEKALVGVKGHFDVTSFGDVGEAQFESDRIPQGGEDILRLLEQSFELLAVPVPNEAVGIGAKWEKSESNRLADQGATTSLKTTVTLVARDAQTATFKVENVASGTMTVNDPRAPKGMSIDRKSTATYNTVVRLDNIAQKVDGQSTTDVTQKVPGQPVRSDSVKMTETLTSK